jgi:response regulator RpfG family c-di-GMP phosphodiesterase
MPHLLLVDDERNVLNALSRVFRNETIRPSLDNLRISAFESAYAAIAFARHTRVDLVVADYRMPEMDGASLLARIRELQPDPPRIILSACADREVLIRGINDAAIFRFMAKPWDPAELKGLVLEALAAGGEAAENRRLADETRLRDGGLTPQEVALRRLEAESPGITHVEFSADGGVLLVQ